MDEAASTNDKVIFTISFLTVLLTSSSFKESLSNIKLVIFSNSFSLFDIITGTSIVLFFSVYLSALDKLRYNYFNLIKIKSLDNIVYAADIFYVIAILVIPGFIIIFYTFSCTMSTISYFLSGVYIGHTDFLNESTISYLSSGVSILGLLLTIYYTIESIMIEKLITKSKSMEESNSEEADSIEKASKAYTDNQYDYVVIFLSNAIENTIYSKLVEKRNLNKKLLNFRLMLELATADGILTPDQVELIKEIKSLRNKIVHGETKPPISEEYVKELLNKTKNLFNKEMN